MGSVGAVGAAPVLSRDVVVAAVRDLAYMLSRCSDVSAALAGPFPLGTETWPLALPLLPHTHPQGALVVAAERGRVPVPVPVPAVVVATTSARRFFLDSGTALT